MKKGIVLYLNSLNIGDDIQGYAAACLVGDDFEVIDRESLDAPDTEEPAARGNRLADVVRTSPFVSVSDSFIVTAPFRVSWGVVIRVLLITTF